LATPSLFGVYETPPQLEGALVVGISQSGESPDLVAVLEEAARQGRPTLAITNQGGSPMARIADLVVELAAGPEVAVAATKTYTAQLAAVALVSGALGGDHRASVDLEALPDYAGTMLAQSDRIAEMAGRYNDMVGCVVLGRGFNHATAFEWALKMQELAYVSAQPFSTADFLHGPIAVIEPQFPVLAVAPAGPTHPDVQSLLRQLAVERNVRLVVISDHDDTLQLSTDAVRLPGPCPEWLTPIPAIIGGQLFTYHLTASKGLDPDRPRGLSKVTKTT
jgi:glucosamine--fructose-6-phosphate aminotransferase (isomerizing)